MPDALAIWAISVSVIVAAGLYFLTRRPTPVVFANPREERLTRKLARLLGCSPAQALPAVRREVEIAPSQSDETLIKRAAYHYRQDMPEASGQTYQDPVPG
ncbi:MAG TPA: hypothetical protein VGY77_11260 [Gemmataceae bacterium]|jgi:hypothetical protein|nr:hypothetical protein [Gemmataceae bacterium]